MTRPLISVPVFMRRPQTVPVKKRKGRSGSTVRSKRIDSVARSIAGSPNRGRDCRWDGSCFVCDRY